MAIFSNHYNSFIIARFVDSGCACSVYLDRTQAQREPGLSTFRNVISFVNLGINHCQRYETGERGLRMIPVGEDQPTPMSTTEAGRKGGSAVRDKYGENYYRIIGKKGGTRLKEKRGSEYYRSIARKGGSANMAKYGPEHFSEMGKKGGKTTKERQDPDFYSRIGKLGGSAKRQKKLD